jgi:hypothetical protein
MIDPVPYPRSRQQYRVACHLPARARNAWHAVEGRCRNLSLQGMLLSCGDGPVPVGESVDLQLELPMGGSVRVCGEVRYHCELPGETARAMGILFTNMAEGHLARLRAFLDAAQRLGGDAAQRLGGDAAQRLGGAL